MEKVNFTKRQHFRLVQNQAFEDDRLNEVECGLNFDILNKSENATLLLFGQNG